MSAVSIAVLRDIDGAIEAARFALTLDCARCRAEGFNPRCPNCGGIARAGGDP